MGIFAGLLIALGFGALAFAVYKGIQYASKSTAAAAGSATAGVNAAADRLRKEGILGSLLPEGLFGGSSGTPKRPTTAGSGAENPANWGELFGGLGRLASGIAPLVKGIGGSNGGSRPAPEEVEIAVVGPSNVEDYKRRLGVGSSTDSDEQYNPD